MNTIKNASSLANKKPKCRIAFYAYRIWMRQIISGYFELFKNGEIDLEVSTGKAPHGLELLIEVTIDENFRIIYDTYDGYNFLYNLKNPYKDFDRILDSCDKWLKYNCLPHMHTCLRNKAKIAPLGLGSIYFGSHANPFDEGVTPFNWKQLTKNIIGKSEFLSGRIRLNSRHMWPEEYERTPTKGDGRAIYIGRIWDPDAPEVENDTVRQDRITLNKFRIELVRCARKELNEHFIGGLQRTAYAEKICGDCIFDGPEADNRWPYLKTMRNVSIGIATSGLHGANGSKLGEYVAASRGIVSTEIRMTLPHPFKSDINYMRADSPDDAVKACRELLKDLPRLQTMMTDNNQYYRQWIQPKALVRHSLDQVKPIRKE